MCILARSALPLRLPSLAVALGHSAVLQYSDSIGHTLSGRVLRSCGPRLRMWRWSVGGAAPRVHCIGTALVTRGSFYGCPMKQVMKQVKGIFALTQGLHR